jgi:hypothetical protein
MESKKKLLAKLASIDMPALLEREDKSLEDHNVQVNLELHRQIIALELQQARLKAELSTLNVAIRRRNLSLTCMRNSRDTWREAAQNKTALVDRMYARSLDKPRLTKATAGLITRAFTKAITASQMLHELVATGVYQEAPAEHETC